MIVPVLVFYGILLAGPLVVKTTNNVIGKWKDRNPVYSHDEALWLDVLAPIELVSEFIIKYDHLRCDDDWRGLSSWLSTYEPAKKISRSVARVGIQADDNDNTNKVQHRSCLVASAFRMSSVDSIMEDLAPTKHHGRNGRIMTTKRLHRALIPYQVCIEWTAVAHTDKPDKWTQVSMALFVRRITGRNIEESTSVRLALIENELKPSNISHLILELIMHHKTEHLTTITATIMKWVKQASESSMQKGEDKTGTLSTIASAVKKWLKHPNTLQRKDLSKDAQGAIESNHIKSKLARQVLEEIEKVLSADDDADSPSQSHSSLGEQVPSQGNVKDDDTSYDDRKSSKELLLEERSVDSEIENENATVSETPLAVSDNLIGMAAEETLAHQELHTEAVLDENDDNEEDETDRSYDEASRSTTSPPDPNTGDDEDDKGLPMPLSNEQPEDGIRDAPKTHEDDQGRNDVVTMCDSQAAAQTLDPEGTTDTSEPESSDVPVAMDPRTKDVPKEEVFEFEEEEVPGTPTEREVEDVIKATVLVDSQTEKKSRKRFFLMAAVFVLCYLNLYLFLTR